MYIYIYIYSLLAKFLSTVTHTLSPEEADFFVVPFYGALAKNIDGCPWGAVCRKFSATMNVLLKEHLTYYEAHKGWHIFLGSNDLRDNPYLNIDTIMIQSIVLNYGPKYSVNNIVIPPNDPGFGYPLDYVTMKKPKHFLFMMVGLINPVRVSWYDQLVELNNSDPLLDIQLHTIEGHRKFLLSVKETFGYMSNSLLCPVPKGDLFI